MKRVWGLLIVLAILLTRMPTQLAESIASGVEPVWTVPDGYNEHDYNKLATFLETTNQTGVKNGYLLNQSYSPDDPQTWFDQAQGTLVQWVEADNGLMLKRIIYNYQSVYGALDLSMCERLEEVSVPRCNLISLDVSECSNLTRVICWGCGLCEIHISGCENLSILNAGMNNLEEIDLSGLMNLVNLALFENQLSEIDLSDCVELSYCSIDKNNLAELNVSNCQNLVQLQCSENYISNLILPESESMLILNVDINNLVQIDTSSLVNLEVLSCGYNYLTELDVSSNTQLQELYVPSNQLTEMDLSNNAEIHCVNLEWYDQSHIISDDRPYDFNQFEDIELYDNPELPMDIVSASYGGHVGYWKLDSSIDDETGTVYQNFYLFAQPMEGFTFEGWFTMDGILLSQDWYWDAGELVGGDITEIMAQFTDGSSGVPGDVDGDGELNVADALLVMRYAMGLIDLSPTQLMIADLTCNGVIEIDDSLLLLRAAMGIF
ncbi:MAG: hypothetical protein IKO51_10990 [Clostridia bacterium]|nr:hypothetical protein [Clostridia bacterium]